MIVKSGILLKGSATSLLVNNNKIHAYALLLRVKK
jgi:hypothetical protein